jgi:hypothetical protein
MQRVDLQGHHLPAGYTILRGTDGHYYPARELPDGNVEYLADERTGERARFWSLGTAVIFAQAHDAGQR